MKFWYPIRNPQHNYFTIENHLSKIFMVEQWVNIYIGICIVKNLSNLITYRLTEQRIKLDD